MRKLGLLLVVIFLTCGCKPQSNQETLALQTQVAHLSTEISEDNSGINRQSATSIPEDVSSSEQIVAQKSEDKFVVSLVNILSEKGWGTNDISGNTFYLTTPKDNSYLIEYKYESPEISRLMIYSIWAGVGTSNLESSVIQEINRINDEQLLAKVSIDSDGDIWLETTIPFESKLDIKLFCNYVEWFEESEKILIYSSLSDYLQ